MLKILFVAQSLKIGGIERALVEQVNSLSETADVYLFLFTGGAFVQDLNENVKIINSNYILRCIGKTKNESKNNMFTFLVRNILAVFAKVFGSKPLFNCIFRFTKTLRGYDYAVSYFNDHSPRSLCYGCNRFVLQNVYSAKKIAWIHSDYLNSGLNTDENREIYKKMDIVVNVSNSMKTKFDQLHIVSPEKSYLVYNRINQSNIINKANKSTVYENDNFTIVTIGRLEPLKGTLDLLHIAKRLSDEKFNFKWFFVGDGVLMQFCQSFISENKISDKVVLIGNIDNPYPYLSNADLFVSGSKIETFGLSIIESLVLNIPVISLRYEAIDEVLNDSNGVVVNSYEEIYNCIKQFYTHRQELVILKQKSSILMDYNSLNNKQIESIFK